MACFRIFRISIASLFVFFSPCFSQGYNPYESESESFIYRYTAPPPLYEESEEIIYVAPFQEIHSVLLLEARHIEPKGLGYCDGYTTLAGFFIPKTFGESYPFVDGRFHIFDHFGFASNFGVGYRLSSPSQQRILGVSLYWDTRVKCGDFFNQLGIGVEMLSPYFDLRANGYIPLGPRTILDRVCDFRYPIGNYFMIERQFTIQRNGFNIEAGTFLVRNERVDFYGAIGPYYFARNICHDFFGVEGRLKAIFKPFITTEISLSHDMRFGTNFQISVGVRIPFGLGNRESISEVAPLWSVDRREIIALEDLCCWEWNF